MVASLANQTLKELQDLYETSVRPLEKLYKYTHMSARQFGAAEIFSKPLILLMGPHSAGKSTMINFLLNTEFTPNAFNTAAEPSPDFHFNLALYGEEEGEIRGAEITATEEFASLQNFGNDLLEKLQAKKINNKLLQQATFVEIPGVREVGTKRSWPRDFPLDDARQWFIDRADLILLVFDQAKLDVGVETEAMLDQLKGRQRQVRLVLNKADELSAEELLRAQSDLVWRVSPLLSAWPSTPSSAQPPPVYAGSLWWRPFKDGAQKGLLLAQEETLLADIRLAIDSSVENRINTARRFAVRIRNHARMVDCYLSTLRGQVGLLPGILGPSLAEVAREVVENPGQFHMYDAIEAAGSDVSRYDLPHPEQYRRFFSAHPLEEFPTLKSTCGFFMKCPVRHLDAAVARKIPELMTKHRSSINKIRPASQTSGTKPE